MATVAPTTETTALKRTAILASYRQIVEKITNLKTVISCVGIHHPMWQEYSRLKMNATLHIIALRLIKQHPELVGMTGPFPMNQMIASKKAIIGQHLPHGATYGSFLKKAWAIVKKA